MITRFHLRHRFGLVGFHSIEDVRRKETAVCRAYLNSHRVVEEIPPSPGTDSTGSFPDTGSFLQSTFAYVATKLTKSPPPLFDASARSCVSPTPNEIVFA